MEIITSLVGRVGKGDCPEAEEVKNDDRKASASYREGAAQRKRKRK